MTAVMETLIGLPQLHLVIQGEARLSANRLENRLGNLNIRPGNIIITMLVTRDVLDMRPDLITKRYSFNTPFEVLIPKRNGERKNSLQKNILCCFLVMIFEKQIAKSLL